MSAKLRQKVDAVIDRLERGDLLRMQLGEDGERQWWMEAPLLYIDDDVVAAARQSVHLVEFGDSLFGLRGNSQTWQAARGRA